jgi:tryptophan synthase alpha chain
VNRLVVRLENCRNAGRLMLVGYLPAGWPDRAAHANCIRAAFDAGVDALEIGLPNPPRPLDGPLVRRAAEIGAAALPDPADAIRLAAEARAAVSAALIALVHRQAYDELGLDDLLAVCVDAGVDALLMPEHTFAEQITIARRARAIGLEQVLFLYLQEDLPLLSKCGLERPVIYLQSADLQTGGPFDADKAHERLGEVREALGGADAYVLVGFGVRGHAEIDALAGSSADGVIVGTELVLAAENGPAHVTALVEDVRPALFKRPEAAGV